MGIDLQRAPRTLQKRAKKVSPLLLLVRHLLLVAMRLLLVASLPWKCWESSSLEAMAANLVLLGT